MPTPNSGLPDAYPALEASLRATARRWCITGVAGFIGSHLLERLLSLGQHVTGIDNFSTGSRANLEKVRALVGDERWKLFRFREGSVTDGDAMRDVLDGADAVLHQAALGSVPRSVLRPLDTDFANVHGTVTVFDTARQSGTKRIVYASSSSVYGDNVDDQKTEDRTGNPLSPYAAGKHATELYAAAFSHSYAVSCIGLRYFNVFGPRQSPEGEYAAVIPRWLASLVREQRCVVFGDGETSRDFCYVENVVRANLLAGGNEHVPGHAALNIAVGERTSLKSLYRALAETIWERYHRPGSPPELVYEPFRTGDIRHSCADVSRAQAVLGYQPAVRAADGFRSTALAFELE